MCGFTHRRFVAVQINSKHHFYGVEVLLIFLDMFLSVLRCHVIRHDGCEHNSVERL